MLMSVDIMPVCRIATLEQGESASQAYDYQQHGYYDYSAYYQQSNVAGRCHPLWNIYYETFYSVLCYWLFLLYIVNVLGSTIVTTLLYMMWRK